MQQPRYGCWRDARAMAITASCSRSRSRWAPMFRASCALAAGSELAEGVGERLMQLPVAPAVGIVVLPSAAKLSAAAVYAEADRLGLTRSADELAAALAALDPNRPEPVNDLEQAARSLESTIDGSIDAARGAGAVSAFVSGSGPTVLGLFPTLQGARLAVDRLNAAGVDAKAARAIHNQSPP
jgi:4-diphosphocytidyl-2-C-methyl-D-erythritol kinase